jgi:hypothetical protein
MQLCSTSNSQEKFGGVCSRPVPKGSSLNPTATAVVREIQAGADEGTIRTRLQDRF